VLYSRERESNRHSHAHPLIDPTGKVLAFDFVGDNDQTTLVEMPTGKFLGSLAKPTFGVGPEAKSWATSDWERGVGFYRRKAKPLFSSCKAVQGLVQWLDSFQHLRHSLRLWQCGTATVTVCDIPAGAKRRSECRRC